MKKYVIVLMLFFLFSGDLFASPFFSDGVLIATRSKNGSGELDIFEYNVGDFKSFSKEVKELAEKSRKLAKDYIVGNVDKINKQIADLRKEVSKNKKFFFFTKSDKKKTSQYLSGLESIIDFLQDITNNEDEVKIQLRSYYKTGVNLKQEMNKFITAEQVHLEALKKDLQDLTISNASDRFIDSKKKEISLSSKRLDLLNSFFENQKLLLERINGLDDRINEFVETISLSLGVYKEAYKTAKLASDISNAYSMLQEIDELNQVSLDMQQSWDDIEYVIDELVQITNSI